MENVIKKRKRSKAQRQDIIFVATALAVPILLFLVFYIGVNFNSLILAFQKVDFLGNTTFAGLSNFKEFITSIFSEGGLLAISFRNSLIMYFTSLIICVPSYILFSYLIYKKCFGHKVIRIVIMIPQVVSSMVITLTFKQFVTYALPYLATDVFGSASFPKLLNEGRYMFGTTLFFSIWSSYAVNVIVYSNAMKEISDEIIESAKIDGVDNMFTELTKIIIPLIHPTLTTFLVSGFPGIVTASGPIMAFYYDKAPSVVYNMGYYYNLLIMKNNTVMYPVFAAGGLLMTFIVAPLTYLLKRFLERIDPQN